MQERFERYKKCAKAEKELKEYKQALKSIQALGTRLESNVIRKRNARVDGMNELPIEQQREVWEEVLRMRKDEEHEEGGTEE